MAIIGIDLGTTFSATSVVDEGRPAIIPIGSERIMPSVVSVSADGQWLVGTPALNQWTLYPERTVRSIKRKMGSDEAISFGQSDKTYKPEQISAIILKMLAQSARQHLGDDVQQAVITVPAYFSDAQRRATRRAGELAGLDVVRIINEPTAAALAYGMDTDGDEIALVYDLGGGTFDVSLVEMSGGVLDVRASHGNTQLGGDDFDRRLADWLIEQFEAEHGVDLRANRQAHARVQRAAERAKIALSTEPFTWVREEYLAEKGGTPLHMEIEVSRAEFESLVRDVLLMTLDSVDRVLDDGGVAEPDHVMLVGGSTYIPAVREMIADHLGLTPRHDVNPSEAVALGAAIQGAIIEGAPIDVILVDVTPFSLGIAIAELLPLGQVEADRFKVLIPRNTTIPVTQKEVFHTLHPDQRSARIEVYQGESLIASQNTLLGEFVFENLVPEAPGALPSVTVQFNLDVNGILQVQAVDRGSKREEGITVEAAHQRISQQEFTSEPLPDVLMVDAVPDTLLNEAERLLSRARHLDTAALRDEIAAVEDAVQARDVEELEIALDDLSDALFDLDEG